MNRASDDAGRSVYEQLTSGVQLPLPAIPTPILAAIADAIVAAWMRIPEHQAATADEPHLNAMMVTQLNQLREQDQLLETLIAAVVRGETINYDGSRLEKRPDLSIILTNGVRARDFPLALESKLIDAVRGKTVALYCKNGLKRFVDGDYGWARTQGLMLAYVRDGSTIAGHLSPFLDQRSRKNPDILCTVSLPTSTSSSVADQAESRHRRRFRYPDRAPDDDPGPITIRHIWVNNPRMST